ISFRSQVMIETVLSGSPRVGIRNPAAQVLGSAEIGAKQAAAITVSYGEGQALLISDDAAYGPAPKNRIVHEAVLSHWDFVGVAYDQAVRTIKVASRFVLRGVGLIVIDV